ncbi:MAG: CooT family nickel-binding protein [Thermoplasmata archaeon]|nr:MAG: CooT family nickel-binding protein [Thermoplasmata archaeon]
MCESTVILDLGDHEEEVMADVVKVITQGNSIICINITGDTKELTDVMIFQVDSLKHNIILKKK